MSARRRPGEEGTAVIMRTVVATISMCAGAAAASAQSFSASGQVGYLQEWELKASLARTVSVGKVEYSGPLTLRHVGLCSANGVEEKSGELRLAVSRWSGAIEGTLAMDGDNCRLAAAPARPYSGLLSCRNAPGVPISFSVEPVGVADMRNPSLRHPN